MNIFYLDKDPVLAARAHADKHVIKMILETATLLTIAIYELTGTQLMPAGSRYRNHPCAKWARTSRLHFDWLLALGNSLLVEYTYRYGKTHAYEGLMSVLGMYINDTIFPTTEWSPPPLCMLPEYYDDDPILAYRNYYMGAKTHLLRYTRREPPAWMQAMELGEHRD